MSRANGDEPQGRRHRPRRQVARRRARGAAQALDRAGVSDPIWSEVPKSRYAPERVEKALAEGAETIFVWGGDGMVQRCVDVLAGTERHACDPPRRDGEPVRVEPGHPATTSREAVHVGLRGRERKLDLGKMNGEHFAVMAGAGLDARDDPATPTAARRTGTGASRTSGRRRRTSASSRSRRASR